MSEQFLCLKIALNKKNMKSRKTISNRPATARFEIILTQKLFVMSFCNHKMCIINMHFLAKVISFLFKNNKFNLKLRSEKPHRTI